MAAKRLSMRKLKEVLRLGALGHPDRAIAQSLDIGRSTVRRYKKRAAEADLDWSEAQQLDEGEIEARLFPPRDWSPRPRPLPDWEHVHKQLALKGMTLELLWIEYKAAHSDCYAYSWFCELYRDWRGSLDLVLRHEHLAGDKVFVDYAGHTMPVVDAATGEVREAQIFVAALGASN